MTNKGEGRTFKNYLHDPFHLSLNSPSGNSAHCTCPPRLPPKQSQLGGPLFTKEGRGHAEIRLIRRSFLGTIKKSREFRLSISGDPAFVSPLLISTTAFLPVFMVFLNLPSYGFLLLSLVKSCY